MTIDRLARRLLQRSGAIRVRTTLIAVLVVGLVLAAAGVSLVVLLRGSLADDVADAAEFRARAVGELVASGQVPQTIRIGEEDDEDEFVQVVSEGGTVVASSENVAGMGAVARSEPGNTNDVDVPFEEDDFLAYTLEVRSEGETYFVVVGQTLEEVDESVSVVANLLFMGLPLLLLVVSGVTWVVVGRALRPVEAIRSRVETISGERLDRRVPVPPTEDEIARLATTMNEMLTRLEESQARQRRFVSDASHELRSPVATIRQHAEVAASHPETSSARELAQVVLAEDLRLQRLVEDLLILARLDEGAAPATKPLDLDDLVFDEVRRVEEGTAKRIDTSRVSGGRVAGDEKQLRSLISNLLENAVRHARAAVAVGLAETNGHVLLEVDDDGIGVPESERERVFERFVRLEEARDRDSGGAGLGLAIVAEVVRAHRGNVELSRSPGGGARLRVELPREES
jgi:signal transduction histidine kinase